MFHQPHKWCINDHFLHQTPLRTVFSFHLSRLLVSLNRHFSVRKPTRAFFITSVAVFWKGHDRIQAKIPVTPFRVSIKLKPRHPTAIQRSAAPLFEKGHPVLVTERVEEAAVLALVPRTARLPQGHFHTGSQNCPTKRRTKCAAEARPLAMTS